MHKRYARSFVEHSLLRVFGFVPIVLVLDLIAIPVGVAYTKYLPLMVVEAVVVAPLSVAAGLARVWFYAKRKRVSYFDMWEAIVCFGLDRQNKRFFHMGRDQFHARLSAVRQERDDRLARIEARRVARLREEAELRKKERTGSG